MCNISNCLRSQLNTIPQLLGILRAVNAFSESPHMRRAVGVNHPRSCRTAASTACLRRGALSAHVQSYQPVINILVMDTSTNHPINL